MRRAFGQYTDARCYSRGHLPGGLPLTHPGGRLGLTTTILDGGLMPNFAATNLDIVLGVACATWAGSCPMLVFLNRGVGAAEVLQPSRSRCAPRLQVIETRDWETPATRTRAVMATAQAVRTLAL